MRAFFRRLGARRRLTGLVDAHASRDTFSGTVLVRQGTTTVLRTARGFANRATGAQNHPNTSFRLGSIGKTFTALAVLRLVEANRLSLDDPIDRLVPGALGSNRILIHHLLSNTSGIPDFLTLPALQPRIAEPHRLDEILEYVRGHPQLFPPGERLSYSNTNWTLLAVAVERVTGAPFASALATLVFEPLGLERTFVDRGDSGPDAALGYTIGESGPEPALPIHPSIELGAGGLRSTVDDLLALDQAVVRPGFLRAHTLEQMARPVARDGGLGYGYGLFSTTRFGRSVLGHTGGTFGFTAFWSRYPAEDAVVIVLANFDNGSAERLERDLAAALLGEPYELPADRTFVTVAPDVLARYRGRYRSQFAGRRIDFAVEQDGDRLYAAFPLLPRALLQPLSDTRFFTRLKGGDVIFEFVGEREAPSTIRVDWSGMAMDCPRVD